MIKVEGVSKAYPLKDGRRHQVFEDLWIDLPGKVNIGVLGRNGAGKSTFVRLLSGVELPDKGRIVSDGRISPPLGLQTGLAGHLSGRDNAKFVCRIRGDSPEAMHARLEYIRAFADLGKFYDEPTKTYSTGMRARLAFALSMAFDYEYYLLDEITSVADEKFHRRADAVFGAKQATASMIVVSHSVQTLRKWCRVAIYIKRGEIVFYDDIEQAIAAYNKDNK